MAQQDESNRPSTPAETLTQALNALYHHPDPAVKEQANRWIQEFQTTPDAWNVTDAALHNAASAFEVQVFCAQTLRVKVHRDFEELPPSAVPQLRDSLVALTLRFAAGPPAVRTQLCLALAGMAAHLPPSEWGSSGVLNWLAERLGRESPEAAIPALLELLAVLPQEGGSHRPSARPERLRAFAAELVAAAPAALQLLSSCLSSALPGAREQVLYAYASWVRLSQGRVEGLAQQPPPIEPSVLAAHPLTAAALEGLESDALFDAAVDAVSELVKCTVDDPEMGIEELDPRALPLAAVLLPRVMALRPRLAAAAAAGDDDTAKGCARLFAEVGETYVALIATAAPEMLAPCEALLDVSAYPDTDIAQLSFDFWHLLRRLVVSPPDGDDAARRRGVFMPAFARLVQNIQGRVRYPHDFAQWRRDERADFSRARYAVADTLHDAAVVLGGEGALQLLAQPLAELSAGAAAGGAFDWREAEAALFCIRSVAKEAPKGACALLAQILGSLASLPAAPELQYTCANVVGDYADWVAAQAAAGGQALLGQMLGLCTDMMGGRGAGADPSADPRTAAAFALKQLCSAAMRERASAAALAGALMPPLIAVYSRIMAGSPGTGCTPAAGGGAAGEPLVLTQVAVLEALEAASRVAAALPTDAEAGAAQLAAPIIASMEQLLQPPPAPPALPPPPPSAAAVMEQFDRMAMLLRIFADGQRGNALAGVAPPAWGLCERALRSSSEERVGEKICRCIKYLVRAIGAAAAPLLPSLAQLLPPMFEQRLHANLLFAAAEVVRAAVGVCAAAPACRAALGPMLAAMFSRCAVALARLSDMNSHPDVADDCLLLATVVIRLCPEHIMQDERQLTVVLTLAIEGSIVQHREACQSALVFLMRAFARTDPADLAQLSAALPPLGPALARRLLAAAAGAVPPGRLADVAEVTHLLLLLARGAALQWFATALSSVPDIAASAPDREAMGMAAQAASAQPGGHAQRRLQEAMDEFGMLCRRNRRSQEAALSGLLGPLQLK